jgi:hypothetical protein
MFLPPKIFSPKKFCNGLYLYFSILNVPSLKSSFTPKSPKGDFPKLLIFSVLPLGLGAKTIKISSLEAF